MLGSILLFFKSRYVVPLYWASLVGFLIVAVQNYLLASPNMADVVGTFAAIFSVIIFVVIIALLYYAIRMRAKGVLR